MMSSFPPHGVGDEEGEGLGDGVRHGRYGSSGASREIHCHSGKGRCMMTDKLARRQLLAVLILCVLFMIGETVGKSSTSSLYVKIKTNFF
jgi:hypothetical protein